MIRRPILLLICLFTYALLAGQDSAWARLRPKYDAVGGLHRAFFGENYRKEWSDSTFLPVINLSTIDGGLKPVRLGGGHQTVSLRLVSANGKEWVLRNIEKDASVLLPIEIRKTFARDVVDDAMSAQHPFSPLVVAYIAEAAGIAHADPVIGLINESPILGEHNKYFAGKVCLLEEREPMGDSENSARMFSDLLNDNDNNIDAEGFLKARLLDLLIGDWDRHPDQWRWVDTRKGKTKYYLGIPRDRDQAFYVNQGLIPRLVSRPWFVPSLQGFRGEIWFPNYSLKEGSFMHAWPAMHMPYEKWMLITKKFVAALNDSVLDNGLRKMPESAYRRRHEQLLQALKERRDNIPHAIESYFHFVNRIAELRFSNKHEFISVKDSAGGFITVTANKIAKSSGQVNLFNSTYQSNVTKEIHIYTGDGNDSVVVDIQNSPVKVRVISGNGSKAINVQNARKKINIYQKPGEQRIYGDTRNVSTKLSDDSLHTAYIPFNRYNVIKPLVSAGFNRDDGFLLALGIQFIHHGFRKTPYAGLNRIVLHHSFATSAFRLKYSGEFIHALGKADLITLADIFAPENTQNFFGRGNESIFNKTGDHITFYRTRFSLYNLSIGLRWRNAKGFHFYIAPAVQHYRFDSSDNKGRILNFPGLINSYDSGTIGKNKTHAGVVLDIGINKRNNRIIPTAGYVAHLKVQALEGVSKSANGFVQFLPEVSAYVPLNRKKTIVLAERAGAGVSTGKPAFYQSVFAGGHENLLGFRQYRFAGEHMVYNNIELRMKVANFTGYIIPGEFGVLGFYDAGRVWVKDERSTTWHQGTGGGLYFAPAKMAVVSIVAGHSVEGWYPYITLGFRY